MTKAQDIRPRAAITLALLFGMNLLDYIDRNILAAVLPQIQAEMGLSSTQAGALGPAFLIAYIVFAPLMGWAGDRYNRTRLLVCGVGLWSLATVGSGFADTYGHLVLARSLLGIGEATYGTLAPTILADLYPRERRGQILSFFYLAIPVGSALGYVLGGLIEPHYGWRMAFWVVGGPGLVAALSGLLLREPPRGAMDSAEGVDDLVSMHAPGHVSWRDYGILKHNRSYIHNTLGMALMTFALGGLALWMPSVFSPCQRHDAPGGEPLDRPAHGRGRAAGHDDGRLAGGSAAAAHARRVFSGVRVRHAAGDAVRACCLARRCTNGLSPRDVPRGVRGVSQHWTVQRHPGERRPSGHAVHGLCHQHFFDPCAGRHLVADCHRRGGRCHW